MLVCDGEETILRSGEGRSGWLDGEKWAIVTLEVTYDGELISSKTYGSGPHGDTLDCSAENGPFVLSVTVVRVQSPSHRRLQVSTS